MKKYVIAVGSPEISKQVQEALFSAGFEWKGYSRKSRFEDNPFLQVNLFADGCLTYGDESKVQVGHIQKGAILITSQEVIADPFQLDGATKPVKEMTMAELEDALGYPVKIKK